MDSVTYSRMCETLERIRHRLNSDHDIIAIGRGLSKLSSLTVDGWLQALNSNNDHVAESALIFLIKRGLKQDITH